MDPAKIAWIVPNDHPLSLADPGAQHIGPITDRMQEYAFAANEPPLHRQKVDQEAARIADRGWRSPSRDLSIAEDSALPSRDRRRADPAMQIAVINTDDRVADPAFDLLERQCRRVFGLPIPLDTNIRESGARQEMDLAHHCPDQPLDMAAIVRRPHRTIIHRDPILLAAALQRFGMELLGVVEVQPLDQSLDWPITGDPARHQPAGLRQNGMGDTQRDRRSGRRFERQMKARDTARVDIDCNGQPRPLDRLSCHTVDRDHIHQRVVDLNECERPRRRQRTRRRSKAITRSLAAGSLCQHVDRRTLADPQADCLAAWLRQSQRPAAPLHFGHQIADSGPLTAEKDPVNGGLHHLVDLCRQKKLALSPSAAAWQETRYTRVGEIARQQSINDCGTAADRPSSRLGIASRPLRCLSQNTDHLKTTTRLMPISKGNVRKIGRVDRAAHVNLTGELGCMGAARSTLRAPRAMSRQTTPSAIARSQDIASTIRPKVGSQSVRAAPKARSDVAGSSGALRSGSSRLALSSRGPRMPRSVAMRKRPPFFLAIARAATKPGRSRAHWARRSTRYFTSTNSERPSLQITRKSGVYRRSRAPSWNSIVIGCEVIAAPASRKFTCSTKSRSSALSCSTASPSTGRKPVTCERRLSGMRLIDPSDSPSCEVSLRPVAAGSPRFKEPVNDSREITSCGKLCKDSKIQRRPESDSRKNDTGSHSRPASQPLRSSTGIPAVGGHTRRN